MKRKQSTKHKEGWESSSEVRYSREAPIMKIIPYGLQTSKEWDALWPEWWHKFIFWKKWRYPEVSISTVTVDFKNLRKSQR